MAISIPKLGSPPYLYRNSDTGTGKTTQAYIDIKNNLIHINQVIVCTKISLLQQWKEGLIKAGVNEGMITLIAGDGSNKPVVSRIEKWFETNAKSYEGSFGNVLLVTFAGITSLQNLERNQKYCCDILFDEIPDVIRSHAVKMNPYGNQIKDMFQLGPKIQDVITTETVRDESREPILDARGSPKRREIKDSVHILKLKNPSEFRRNFNKLKHNYEDGMRDFLQSFANPFYVHFIKRSVFEQSGEMYEKLGDDSQGNTVVLSALKRKLFVGWHSCAIMSADWNYSITGAWLTRALKLPFREDRSARKKLENRGRHSSDLINRIKFVYVRDPEKHPGVNSKRYLGDYGERVDNELMKLLEEVNSPEFLLCTNNNRKSNRQIIDLPNCVLVSPRDEGSNGYMGINTFIADVALNLPPEIAALYNALGIPEELQYQAITLNTLYQIASRTSLRDRSNNDEVTIVVMDRKAAIYLAQRFTSGRGGVAQIRHISEISFSEIEVPPIESPESLALQVSDEFLATRSSGNCTDKPALSSLLVQGNGANMYFPATGEGKAKPDLNDIAATNSALSGITLQASVSQRYPSYEPCELKELEGFLSNCSERVVADRDAELGKIYPCIFAKYAPEIGRGARSKSNFMCANLVILDFDGGKSKGVLTPEAAIEIFNPSRQNKKRGIAKHSFIIHSTFNCSHSSPNRFRMIFFLRNPARTPEDYEAVVRYLTAKIKGAGYSLGGCGLDKSSYNCVQAYWLPCVNSLYPDSAFYKAVNLGKSRDVYERYGIDATKCLDDFPPVIENKPVHIKASTVAVRADFDLDNEIATYRALTDGRRLGLLRLAKSCAFQGRMSPPAIEHVLTSVVDINCAEMQKRISDTMQQLENDVVSWGNEAA
ncbi:DEAD/DEAH box helicase family protein [uncultured Pseudoteredinibacter sp.]|uniref:DEAD/DEAH box helicase family protein n=1 Tax=uncultured Pseudoteredinibacter sp. TaxID=1641701 RepID=UPI00261FFF4E|nr:DEAD/DEAH box helicase family protein [uncultured Pseudoteredinibacter sp.]